MRKVKIKRSRNLKRNTSVEGKSIETKLGMKMEGEQVDIIGKSAIYTEREMEVLPHTNIRTDRFEHMAGAMDQIARSTIARRNAPATKQGLSEQATEGTEK